MFKQIIRAVHYLRVYFLAFFLIALFYYIGQQPADFSRFVGANLSRAVGMSTSVPENQYNRLALQLSEKEKNLNVRESELEEREAQLKTSGYPLQIKLMGVMAGGIFLLFILISLNFYFDYRRKRKEKFINK